jgi:N-methylhydantoinase A
MIRLAVDIGGTFTDVVLDVDGQRHTGKVLTTPRKPEEGFLTGVQEVLARAGISAADVDAVVHGTTLATNAIIERKGSDPVLVTTEGFRDSIEIAFEHRFEQSDLKMVRPPPLIARNKRFGVPERMAADGTVLLPLDEAALEALAAKLASAGTTAVAVGFLHSYQNPSHERRAAEILQAAMPDAFISVSSEVSPEIREYDRISTTVANAYVRPLMEGYLKRLETLLRQRDFTCQLLMITSSGGMCTVETACKLPIRLVESGPAGGAILAKNVAMEIGAPEVVSFDMGGTTAKICLIDGYQPLQSRTFEVAREYRFLKGSGLPLRIPVIEMVEIGAGGGSIAAVDDLDRITVGPESASSSPGPACYARGGERPTVTDADLVLGRLDPERFAGGQIRLDTGNALAALDRHVATHLRLEPAAAAAGVSEIVDENMANAARLHAIEWGKVLDQRTMIAFGGAAPLHAARLADKCGISRVVIPTGAGVGSAIGFLLAPVSYEVTRSRYQNLAKFDPDAVNALFAEMRREAVTAIRQGDATGDIVEEKTAFIRYCGQGHEIDVALPARDLATSDRGLIAELFAKRYAELYGRTIPHLGQEVMTWRLSASIPVPPARRLPDAPPVADARPQTVRPVFDTDAMKAVPHGIYARKALEPGMRITGPAIIIEDETSTVVGCNFDARILASGYILLEKKA